MTVMNDELYDCVEIGDYEGVRKALRKGASPNCKRGGKDVLDEACASVYFGRLNKIAKLLLDSGSDLKGRCRACLLGIGDHQKNSN
jgi:hypothetical protein